jgi:hypothetical protein
MWWSSGERRLIKESFVDGQQECMMADGSVIKTALEKVYIDSPYFV